MKCLVTAVTLRKGTSQKGNEYEIASIEALFPMTSETRQGKSTLYGYGHEVKAFDLTVDEYHSFNKTVKLPALFDLTIDFVTRRDGKGNSVQSPVCIAVKAG